jgi:hypothetical protein
MFRRSVIRFASSAPTPPPPTTPKKKWTFLQKFALVISATALSATGLALTAPDTYFAIRQPIVGTIRPLIDQAVHMVTNKDEKKQEKKATVSSDPPTAPAPPSPPPPPPPPPPPASPPADTPSLPEKVEDDPDHLVAGDGEEAEDPAADADAAAEADAAALEAAKAARADAEAIKAEAEAEAETEEAEVDPAQAAADAVAAAAADEARAEEEVASIVAEARAAAARDQARRDEYLAEFVEKLDTTVARVEETANTLHEERLARLDALEAQVRENLARDAHVRQLAGVTLRAAEGLAHRTPVPVTQLVSHIRDVCGSCKASPSFSGASGVPTPWQLSQQLELAVWPLFAPAGAQYEAHLRSGSSPHLCIGRAEYFLRAGRVDKALAEMEGFASGRDEVRAWRTEAERRLALAELVEEAGRCLKAKAEEVKA